MNTKKFTAQTADYLSTARGLPAELAEHMATHGFRLLDGAAVAHMLRETFGLGAVITEYPEQGLLIPYHDAAGAPLLDRKGGEYRRVRCLPHALHRNGETPKYEAPKGSTNHLSVPLGAIADALAAGRLYITEGEIKAWVATWYGFPTIGVSGVWNWKGNLGGRRRINKADGSHEFEKNTAPIPEWDALPWPQLRERGAVVVIAFDSDARTNDKVSHAQNALAKHIRDTYGVEVKIAELPDQAGGKKNGLDDYLLSAGPEAVRLALDAARPSLPGWQPPTGASADPFDLGAYLDGLSPDASPLELADLLAPVWRELAAEDDRAIVDAWKNAIGERFGLKPSAMAGNIKAARDTLKAEANARRKTERDDARKRDAARARDRFGLDLSGTPYTLSAAGVGMYLSDRDDNEPVSIAPRPIWPKAIGRDVTTGETWIKLCWVDALGREQDQWCRSNIASDREAIGRLDGAPVSTQRWPQLSTWLLDAQGCIPAEQRGALVTSRTGWVDVEDGRRFVLPGDPVVEFIGPAAKPGGTLEAWAEGLRLLVEMGEDGFTGLACVGLAAAAPLVRLVGRRNPVLGLVAESSTGKSSVIAYAMSVWHNPRGAAVLGVGSTPKGIEDAALGACDLPIFVDELHRLYEQDPRKAEAILYFIGNGKRRTTSSRAQVVSGGEEWCGVGFYAAEHTVLDKLNAGAQVRAIELSGDPMRTRSQSERLQAIARDAWGAAAFAIADKLPEWCEAAPGLLTDGAAHFASLYPQLRGDEAGTAAMVSMGLSILSEITGVDLPAADVGAGLAGKAARSRGEMRDRASAAFEAMLAAVEGGAWESDRLIIGGEVVAWRGVAWGEAGLLDINPQARFVRDALMPYGGDIHARTWADRGWLVKGTDGRNKVRRREGANLSRVWRVPADQLAAAECESKKVVMIDARGA